MAAVLMITSITIDNLRGVERGALGDLGPLTLLTGAGGCGKSAVLDALLISASPVSAAESLGRAVSRHRQVPGGARWLIRRGAEAATVAITRSENDHIYQCSLSVASAPEPGVEAGRDRDRDAPYWDIEYDLSYRTADDRKTLQGFGTVRFAMDNSHEVMGEGGGGDLGALSTVYLIEPGVPGPLTAAYSETVRQGKKREVLELVRGLVPGGDDGGGVDAIEDIEDIEILTEADGAPTLYVTRPAHSVPVGLAGGGMSSLLQLALQLAARSSGLVLIEQPEARQHPRALAQTARAMLAAVRRGLQIVASTSSLELIERVAEQAAADGALDDVAVFALELTRGALSARRYAGADLERVRAEASGELR